MQPFRLADRIVESLEEASSRFISRKGAIRRLVVVASLAAAVLIKLGTAGAETVFSVGPDGSLQMGQATPTAPKVGNLSISGDPEIDEWLRTFRAEFLRGDIADAMITAQRISDKFWYSTHTREFTVSATGGLIAEPNGKRFVDDGACVNTLGRATSFIAHDARGNQYSVLPAHTINPATTQYRFTRFGDAAVKQLAEIKSRRCFDISNDPARSWFKVGVTVGGEQIAGVLFPFKPLMESRLVQYELTDLRAKLPHLDVGHMLTADDVTCKILPGNIDAEQLTLKGIYGGSGRPLISIENGSIEVVGIQSNVTPVVFRAGERTRHMLCYASANHIRSLMEMGQSQSAK